MSHLLRSRAATAALAFAAALAAGSASAQSIKITSITPASGNFPTSGGGVTIAFTYDLGATPDAQVAAFLKASPAAGPGQTGLAPSFSPVWLTAGPSHSGSSTIVVSGYCQDASTVPSGTVTELSVVLSKSGHLAGPVGPEIAKDAKTVQYAYACPGVQPPNQGRGRPDITSKKGVTVGGDVGGAGGKFAAWNTQLSLAEADSKLPVGNGKCAFNVSYDMTNAGTAATAAPFRNRIYEDGAVVSDNSGLHLAAGETKQVNTQAYLTPGSHVLTLRLDDGGAAPNHEISESNESNNVFAVKFHLEGSCKPKLIPVGGVKLPPGAVAPTPTMATPR